jgi:two-component system response regulator HydG
MSPEALKVLLSYEWPGNVRELENTIERALVVSCADMVMPEDLPEKVTGYSTGKVLTVQPQPPAVAAPVESEDGSSPTLESIEKAYIFWVLNQTGWNKTKAAKILGIDASTLYRKIDRYELKQG